MGRIINIFRILAITLPIFAVYNLSAQEEKNENEKLILAYNDYRPYCFKDSNNKIRGIFIEYWQRWSQQTGIPIELKLMPWSQTIKAVADGKADIIPAIIETPERRSILSFSEPYFNQQVYIFYNKSSQPIETLADLADKRVAVVKESYPEIYLKQNQSKAILETYSTVDQVIQAVLDKDVSLFLMEKTVALNYLASKNALTAISRSHKPLYQAQFHAAVQKGNSKLIKTINSGLKALPKDELPTIIKSWQGTPTHTRFQLKVAYEENDAPFQFKLPNGQASGILINLWQLIAEKINADISFISGTKESNLELLHSGKANYVAGMFFSKHDPSLHFIAPIWTCEINSFYKKEIVGIKTIHDLANYHVGVVKDSFSEVVLNNNVRSAKLHLFPSPQALFKEVSSGKINIFVEKTASALYYLDHYKLRQDFHYHLAHPLAHKKLFIVSKDSDSKLNHAITRALKSITASDHLNIENQYLTYKLKTISRKQRKIIRVACSTGYPPLSSMSSSGELRGILIDLWKLWANKIGQKVEFKISTWEDSIRAIENGEADIHMGLFKTPEREKWLNFTAPIYEVESRLFFPVMTAQIKDLKQLAGKKIGVIDGSYQEEYLKEKCPQAHLVKFQNSDDMITSCAYGWLSAFMDEVPTAVVILKRLGRLSEFTSLAKASFKKKIYGAVLQGNDKLLYQINKGLDLISSDDMDKMENRYLDGKYQVYSDTSRLALTEAEKKWLKDHPEITLGMGRAWPPIQYVDSDGKFKGIAGDYINLLNRKLNLELKPERYLSWSEILEKGKKREIDIFACVAKTPERQKYMTFSAPYLSFPLVVFAKADDNSIKSIKDLYGKKVAILRGLASHESLKTDHPDLTLVPADSIYEGLNNVISGKTSAYIGNLATASYIIQSNQLPNLKVACSYKNNALCFGVRSDWPELTSIINKTLDTLSQEERDNIQRKWFSVQPKELKTQTTKSTSFLTQVVFAFCIIIFLLLVAVIKEKRNTAKYIALVENDNELLIAFKPDGSIIHQSDTAKEMLGFTPGELLNTQLFKLFQEADHDQLKATITDLEAGKVISPWKNLLLDKQGNTLEFESYFLNKLDSSPLNALVMHSKRDRDDE